MNLMLIFILTGALLFSNGFAATVSAATAEAADDYPVPYEYVQTEREPRISVNFNEAIRRVCGEESLDQRRFFFGEGIDCPAIDREGIAERFGLNREAFGGFSPRQDNAETRRFFEPREPRFDREAPALRGRRFSEAQTCREAILTHFEQIREKLDPAINKIFAHIEDRAGTDITREDRQARIKPYKQDPALAVDEILAHVERLTGLEINRYELTVLVERLKQDPAAAVNEVFALIERFTGMEIDRSELAALFERFEQDPELFIRDVLAQVEQKAGVTISREGCKQRLGKLSPAYNPQLRMY